MAITNAQQAKQIMNEGGPMRKIKGQDHMLAYITPSEKDILVELGGQETMTPEGILAYPPEGKYGSSGTGSYDGGSTGMASTGGANFSSGENNPGKGNDNTNYAPPAQEIISGKSYDVTTDPQNVEQRDNARFENNLKKQTLKDDFINKPADYNKYTPAYLKFIADINRKPNRKFFIDRVLKAGKIPNYADLYDEDFDIEEAYKNYMDNRLAGKTDAMGNPVQGFSYGDDGMLTGNFIDSGGDNDYVPPVIPEDDTTEEDPTVPRNLGGLAPRFAGSIFDFTGLADGGRAGAMDGGRMMNDDDPTGGIMDLESGRQMYFLGKLVKKATRAVKKIAKSPIGKAALLYFGGGALGNLAGGSGLAGMFKGAMTPGQFFTKNKLAGIFSKGGAKNILFGGQKLMGNAAKNNFVDFSGILGSGGKLSLGKALGLGLGIPTALDLMGVGKEEDGFDIDEYYRTQGINIADIRNNPYNYLSARNQGSRFAADGGLMRNGYQEGGDAEPVAKETMPLLDMEGKEMDLREEGGFVPIGRMERADDVPARLSKNEFVFTADAVRNAGEGDIDKGAEVMYNMMKNLESGGEVSEESQGLDGAREMFKTSQRLEEVL